MLCEKLNGILERKIDWKFYYFFVMEDRLSNEERTKSGRKITNSKRKRKSSKLLQNEIPVEVGEVVKHDDVAPQEVNNEDKEPVVQDDEGIVQKLKKLILK